MLNIRRRVRKAYFVPHACLGMLAFGLIHPQHAIAASILREVSHDLQSAHLTAVSNSFIVNLECPSVGEPEKENCHEQTER
jgi:hypothetical protein